jgi:F-type H+-transporting ATPase subunit gamma
MPSAKDIKKKIRSTSNTKKITRTMEMVATVKSKLATDRIKATTPYATKLADILGSLAGAGTTDHPLIERPDAPEPKKVLVVVVTANRGLAGGYNAKVLESGERWLREQRAAGREVQIYMIGKKGISRCKFLKIPLEKALTQFKDLPPFKEAAELADDLMARFLSGEFDRVVVVTTRFLSQNLQKPEVFQLLPIPALSGDSPRTEGPPGAARGGKEPQRRTVEFIFEPGPEEILKTLLPLSVKTAVYRVLVEASASEQIARRIAMKLATDNAEEMIKLYTRNYNRQRQAGITRQITEIVSGADALE